MKIGLGLCNDVSTRECHLFSWYLESSFSKWISMRNFIMNVPQTLILFKIATALEGAVIDGQIKVCGTFIIKFYIEILLLKDDSRYHENKWHSLRRPFLHLRAIVWEHLNIEFYRKKCIFSKKCHCCCRLLCIHEDFFAFLLRIKHT